MVWRKALVTMLILAGGSLPVSNASAASKRLTLYGGVTLYPNPAYDSLNLAEFSFSINRHELEFYQPEGPDSLYYGKVFAQVDIYGPRGAVVDSASTYFSVRVRDLTEAAEPGLRLFNKVSLFLIPGIYSARLTVIDAVSKRRAEVYYPSIEVIPPVKDRVSLSDVCVAYDVTLVGDQVAGAGRRMVRNGFRILPNPLATFGPEDSVVALYAEAYNLSYAEDKPGQIDIALSALNADSALYRDLGERVLESSGRSAVVAESIDIRGWPAGVYYGRLAVLDRASGQSDTAYAAFQIVSAAMLAEAAARQSSTDPYDRLSLAQKVQLVTYLLTPSEKEALDRLSDRAKLNYLDQYWRDHDETPETPEIENRLDLIERFQDANRLFSLNTQHSDGWNTDLGRVLMKYGRPSKIDDNTASGLIGNPTQIWYYYNMAEGKFFIFEEGFTLQHYDFTLVHSNVEGEPYDPVWQERLDEGWFDMGLGPQTGPSIDEEQ